MVTVIDPQIAGISGDMLLCALVNIGANKSKIIDGVYLAQDYLKNSKIKNIDFTNVQKHGIQATQIVLDIDERVDERKGTDVRKCISLASDKIGLAEKAKSFATSTIDTLLAAETRVHGTTIESVHLHEASGLDTVVDIVGSAIALNDLGYFDDEIITTPVAVGGGTLSFSHGVTTNPGGAILEIFKNSKIAISGGKVKDELTTPTGASMLVNLATKCSEFYPQLKVNTVGYGAGTKNFDEFPNVLKIVHGEKTTNYERDSVIILETNVDDVSGEILGNMLEKIMKKGAKDVTITPAITKKSRPTNLISVICDTDSMNSVLDLLFSETGTLGIRIRASERFIVPRSIVKTTITIQEKKFPIRYKIIGKDKNFKIESDDIKLIAESINKSYKQTEELIRNVIKKELS
ncbi:MAG: nickel pincer cofactor biosynthesis protein LarC [Thaumarchaeota archaeon]|nr:nickel pincer cofactor biosynthesis protein LarC [Nitrososphaerota archaeon]